jgi:hypothetical protein
VLAFEDVQETVISSGGGLNVYRTDWTFDYIVPSVPSGVPVPANPLLGIDGQNAQQAVQTYQQLNAA